MIGSNHAVLCEICGAADAVVRFEGESACVWFCPACTGLFNRPRAQQPAAAAYDAAYFDTYRQRYDRQAEVSRRIVALMKQVHSAGAVLDYGCGSGVFLHVAAENGYTNNCGVDTGAVALRLARDELAGVAPVELVDPAEQALPPRRFEFVTFLDSIAHIPDANALLARLVKDHLAHGGAVVIRTPSINSAHRMFLRLMAGVLPRRLMSSLYFIPQRLMLLNPCALTALLARHGLRVVVLRRSADYRERRRPASLKGAARAIITTHAPNLLNPENSLLVIAQRQEIAAS